MLVKLLKKLSRISEFVSRNGLKTFLELKKKNVHFSRYEIFNKIWLKELNIKTVLDIGANIGEFSIINSGSIIGHDVFLSDFSIISGKVFLGGGCKIGENSLIGPGVTVLQNINIGSEVIVSVGSTIGRNIPNGKTTLPVLSRVVS